MRSRKAAQIAAVLSIGLFTWALAANLLGAAIVSGTAAAVSLSLAAGRWLLVGSVVGFFCALLIWGGFGTVTGYYWLNRGRLTALVDVIAGLPPQLRSIEIGHDGELESGTASAMRYDDYRFINGTAVTLYRRQVAPSAPQPVLYADDVLRKLRVSRERYDRIRALLARLSLSGFDRQRDGEIKLSQQVRGRAPWVAEYTYRPDGREPGPECMIEQRRLDRRWFWRLCG